MILIRKVKDEYGWLGNMSPYSIVYNESLYRTTESLFQCLRFDNEEIIEDIRKQPSPMGAKMVAKKNKEKMIVVPRSYEDVKNMELVISLKVEQHADIKKWLLLTKSEQIVEDCSKRPNESGLYWGSALIKNVWVGENKLGLLWMELRRYSNL